MMDFEDTLKRQARILENLSDIPDMVSQGYKKGVLETEELIHALMFTMYKNSSIREKQEKYDMATLLLYRLLEMIMQRRLSHYGLFASKMDYTNMKIPESSQSDLKGLAHSEMLNGLRGKVLNIKSKVFGRGGSRFLPEQVALLDGYIILLALDDEIKR